MTQGTTAVPEIYAHLYLIPDIRLGIGMWRNCQVWMMKKSCSSEFRAFWYLIPAPFVTALCVSLGDFWRSPAALGIRHFTYLDGEGQSNKNHHCPHLYIHPHPSHRGSSERAVGGECSCNLSVGLGRRVWGLVRGVWLFCIHSAQKHPAKSRWKCMCGGIPAGL